MTCVRFTIASNVNIIKHGKLKILSVETNEGDKYKVVYLKFNLIFSPHTTDKFACAFPK